MSMWWLVFGVLSRVVISSSVYPLPHPYHGCPHVRVWGSPELYVAESSTSWQSNGSVYIAATSVDLSLKDFLSCASVDYDSKTRMCAKRWTFLSMDAVTCVYADNYCPTLKVNSEELNGDWIQQSNSTWKSADSLSCVMTIDGRDADGRLKFKCRDTHLAFPNVRCNVLHTLTGGHNVLNGLDVFYAPSNNSGHCQPDCLFVDTPIAKLMQVPTLSDPTSPLRVWISSSNPLNVDNVVVVSTISRNDTQPALLYVQYVDEATAIIQLATCASTHAQETVNLMFVERGWHSPDGLIVMYAETVPVLEGVSMDLTYPSKMPFLNTFAVTQLQSLSTAPVDHYIQSRVIRSTMDGLSIWTETATRDVAFPPAQGIAGYVTVSAPGGLVSGLFGTQTLLAISPISVPPNTPTAVSVIEHRPSVLPLAFVDTAQYTTFSVNSRASVAETQISLSVDGAECGYMPPSRPIALNFMYVVSVAPTSTTTKSSAIGRTHLQLCVLGVMLMLSVTV